MSDSTNSSTEIITDNVTMVLDENYLSNIPAKMTENSWEILRIAQMNSFVFPRGHDSDKNVFNAKYENKNRCWCPEKIDIAFVLQTINDANSIVENGQKKYTKPSFVKEKDYFSNDYTYGIANRPCGFLTSRKTLMPMIIIPTELYIQNGTIIYDDISNKKYNSNFNVTQKKFGTCFNWIINTKTEDGTNKFKKQGYQSGIS